MPKPYVCTMYVAQQRDPETKKLTDSFLSSDYFNWATFARSWKFDTRSETVKVMKANYSSPEYRIVPVRVTTLSAGSKRSKHRTG